MVERRTPRGARKQTPKPPTKKAKTDMGAHPAYGKETEGAARRPGRTQEEDYGARGLHREAGSTKVESIASEGVDAESSDRRWQGKKPAARKGRNVARGQSVEERQTITQGRRRR